MNMPAQRYKLLQDVYMPLNGQWSIVLSGTVFDAPAGFTYPASMATPVAGAPASVPVHTAVSNARTK